MSINSWSNGTGSSSPLSDISAAPWPATKPASRSESQPIAMEGGTEMTSLGRNASPPTSRATLPISRKAMLSLGSISTPASVSTARRLIRWNSCRPICSSTVRIS